MPEIKRPEREGSRGPHEGQGLRYLVRHLHRSFTRLVELELGKQINITYQQWSCLRVLLEKDGLSQRELSDELGIMENTTVSALNVMEKRGWIERRRDSKDGRRLLVTLTPAGRELDSMRFIVREINRLAVGSLSREDQEVLRRGLETMLSNLDLAYDESVAATRAQARSKSAARRARKEA